MSCNVEGRDICQTEQHNATHCRKVTLEEREEVNIAIEQGAGFVQVPANIIIRKSNGYEFWDCA